MLETSSNQELLDAWRQGNEQAAQILVRRYMVRLTALARSRMSRKLARRLDAEDVVLSAWRSFFVATNDGRVIVPEDDDLWPILVTLSLRKLARQATRHTAQRRDLREEISLDHERSWQAILSREPSPDEAVMLVDELESFMASLNPDDRELLSRRLRGENQAAIAEAMNRSERTIRRSLERIRDLFVKLQQRGEDAETFSPMEMANVNATPDFPRPAVVPAFDSLTRLTPPIEYGDLQLLKLIGQGGFGKVYQARRSSDGALVAVKYLKKRFWTDRRSVQSMFDETTRVTALSHPNIIRHFGWGLAPRGGPFIVMEWIDGTDARRWSQNCKPPLQHVIECCTAIADGLATAHAAGIIHGDVTPSNVLRRADGTSLLTDFGFAQSLQNPQRRYLGGTPGFLSPEQISDVFGPLTQRTDVYGLGGLIYALTTGHPPFGGSDVPAILASIVSSRPPVPASRLAAQIPRDLDQLILDCLRKEPAERHASAADVREILQSIAQRCRFSSTMPR
jgi:DNA-directed RNA polymerase specialized sigma24 family protein